MAYAAQDFSIALEKKTLLVIPFTLEVCDPIALLHEKPDNTSGLSGQLSEALG